MTKSIFIALLLLTAIFSLHGEPDYRVRQEKILSTLTSNLRSPAFSQRVLRDNGTRQMMLGDVIRQYYDSYHDDWQNDYRNVYHYNDQGLYDEIRTYYWDYEEEEWDDDIFFMKFWWNDRNLLVQVSYLFDFGWQQIEIMKLVQNFNPDDQIIDATVSMREGLGDWETVVYLEFQYDYNNRCEYILFTLYDEIWEEREMFMERIEFTYDYRNRLQTATVSMTEDGENWEYYEQSNFNYHQNDTSDYSYVQHFLNTIIFTMEQEVYTQVNRPMYSSEYHYEWYDDEWELYERGLYHYQANDKLEQLVWEYLDYDTWYPVDRELYYYDTDGYNSQVLFQYRGYEDEWLNYERALLTMSEVSSAEKNTYKPSAKPFRANNYPNPFNPETTIEFFLTQDQPLTVSLFNSRGQLITLLKDDLLRAGNHRIVWNGKNKHGIALPSGIYFYEIRGAEKSYRGKMMLLK